MPNWTYEDKNGTRLTFESDLQPSPDIVPTLFENYYSSQRDIGGYVSETLAAVPRGFANSFLSMGEGLVELADAGTNLIGLDDLIEDENEVVNTIREGKRYLDEEFGADAAYRDTWANKFGEGVGSFASFFTPVGVGKALGLAGKGLTALGAGAGAAAGAGEQSARVDAARAAGINVSQAQEDLSIALGGGIGTTEAFVPINRLLKFVPKSAYSDSVRKRMVSRLNEALVTGGLEGGQEVLSAVLQDVVERNIYNENLPENDSLFDDFTVGGAIGTIADLALRRRKKGIDESERDHEAELRERELNSIALEKELVDNLKAERAAAVKDVTEDLGFPLPDAPPDIPEINPSTIGFPTPEQIGRRMATPRDYITVQFPDGSVVQGQEKTVQRNKNTTTTQVEYVDQNNEKSIKTIATNGVPNEGFSVLERKPQETIVSSALRNKRLAGEGTTAASTKKAGDTYAHHIRATMGLRFPTHITFKAEQVQSPDPQDPQFAAVGSDGVQYGTSFNTINEAAQLASSLHDQAIDQQIDLNAISRIEATQESYDDATKSILKRYNRRIVHPEENLIPYYAVNEAAGTITEKGFDETVTFMDQFRDLFQGRKMNEAEFQRNLTASQKINQQRTIDGKTETNLFTPQEAKKVLGKKFDRIADIIYFEGRESSDVEVSPVPEKVGVQEIQKILDQKNIASAIDSKEFNEMARAFVGKTGVNRMTNGERKLLAQRLAVLPSFPSPTILPDFGPKIYTADQLALATEHVQKTGDVSEAGILSAAAIDPDSPRAEQKSFAILKELKSQGVIVNGKVPEFEASDQVRRELEEGDRAEREFRAKERPMEDTARLLPSPEKAEQGLPLTSKQMDRLRSTLENHMNRYGLKEVGVNLDYALRNAVVDSNGNLMFGVRRVKKDDQSVVPIDEAGNFVAEEMAPEGTVGYYSPVISKVFLSVDRVDPSKKGVKQISNELVKTLDHEAVHALRQLDLWTDKEWNSLELAARNTKRKDGETYLKWAQSTYNQPGTSPILQMEEAIAEMTKDLKAGIRLGGKPRSSLERVGEFFERLVSFIRGTGYQSINDIMENVEAGVIGSRERGVVRTLRLTEKARGAVPDREILPVGDVAGDPELATQTRADFGNLYSRKGSGQVSTRFPTAVKSTEDPLEDLLVNDYNTFVNSKDVFKKNMELIKNAGVYPNLQKDKSLRTDEQKAEAFVEHVKDNLLYLYDSVPEETRDVSKLWYVGANKLAKQIADSHGLSMEQASAVLANLSPQKDWYQNASLGERTADIYFNERDTAFTPEMKEKAKEIFFRGSKKAQKANKKLLDLIGDMSISDIEAMPDTELSDALTAVYIRTFDETYNDRGYKIISPNGEILDFSKKADGTNAKVGWGSLNEIAKAVTAMRNPDIDSISLSLGTQNKVRNFYNNIFNPESDLGFVTIDTHAVAAGLLQPFSGKSEPVLHNFGGGAKGKRGASSSKVDGLNGTYSLYEEGYRRAAGERGVLPREMQSITWEAVRGLFKPEYKAQESNTEFVDKVWKRYNKKQITLEQARREILDHAANGEIESPDWERSNFRPDEGVRATTYERKLPDDGVSRQDSLDGPDGRGRGYATGSIPRQVKQRDTTPPPIPEQTLADAVNKNIDESFDATAGDIPRSNFNAAAEAQVVANKTEATPIDEGLDVLYSRARQPDYDPEFESLTGGLSADPTPNRTPVETYIEETELGPIGARLTKLKMAAVNKYARWEDISSKFFANELADSSSISALMMTDRSKAMLGAALKYGYPVYENGAVQVKRFVHNGKEYRGLIDIMAPLYPGGNEANVSLEELAKRYAIFRRSEYLNQNPDLKTPVKRGEEAAVEQALMREINKHINPETGNPIVLEWYDTWQAYNNKTIQFLKDTGMVDEAGAEAWSAASVYFPFYKQTDGSNYTKGPNIFKGLTGTTDFKQVGKSESPINVPMLEAITRNLSAAIDMGMKNIAQQRVIRDSVELGIAREIPPGEEVGNRNVINFKVNGVRRRFEMDDPLVYESMMAMGGQDLGAFVDALAIPANFLRELVTREPGFMLANMLRDTLSAWVTSGARFVPVASTLKNFVKSTEELEMLGVVGGVDFKEDVKDIGKYIARESRKRGSKVGDLGRAEDVFEAPVLKIFKNAWQWAGQATTQSDAATRKAVHDDVLRRTNGNIAEAQFQALEVLNYGRRGYHPVMKMLTAWIPFLNARLQGLDVINRAARGKYSANKEAEKGKRIQTFVIRGAVLSMLTAMYYSLVSDDEEYKSQEDYVRDNNWILPTGLIKKAFGVDIDEPIKMPIPFEIGLIFKTLPERIMRSYEGEDTARKSLDALTRATASTLEVNFPQFMLPLLEASTNHNTYTGREIVPIYLSKNAIPALQSRFTTNELAKSIGESLNISPLKVQHVMEGYTGTLGSYVLAMADSYMRGDKGAMPERKLSDYPVLKRFFAKKEGKYNQAEFYDLMQSAQQASASLKDLEEKGDVEGYHNFLQAKSGLLSIKKDVDYLSRKLRDLRKQRDEVLRSSMSPGLKETLADQINREMNYLTASVPILERIADRSSMDLFDYP